MFQTEPILFLQSFASDFLTGFFVFFTEVGKSEYFTILIIVVLFGFSIRKGYFLLYVVILTGLADSFFKNLFALPRPANVDSRVLLPGKDYPNPTTHFRQGAKSFFGALPQGVVDQFRLKPFDSWGFPSGHAANAMALWGSVFRLFRKAWVRIISIIFIAAIPLSRMYLGRHFLADILAGSALGFFILFLIHRFLFRRIDLLDFLFEKGIPMGRNLRFILFWFFFLVLPVLLALLPLMDTGSCATLFGFNLGFVLLRFRGFPEDSGLWWQRLLRILIGFILFSLAQYLFVTLFGALHLQEKGVVFFCLRTISFFLPSWLGIEICVGLKLYRRRKS